MICTLFWASTSGLLGSEVGVSISGDSLLTHERIEFNFSKQKSALVVIFLSAKCPCSLSHEPYLKSLSEHFSKFGISFVGVHSNADESAAYAKTHFESSQLPFSIIADPQSDLANRFGALSTPHAYVVSPSGEILYAGGVSDSSKRATATENYLEDALNALTQGAKISKNRTRVLGCPIRRP